jgi:hypothetical protein
MILNKPKLVFLQWQHQNLPNFLQAHMQLHVKCLANDFEVQVVNWDCDYQEICDTFEPDLVVFESGYKTSISKRIQVENTSSHNHIPKIGLHNGDPWCDCRIGFMSDMAHWGIDTFFTICTTTGEHSRDINENLYVWANSIDDTIYHDYGQEKVIPILFNGNTSSVYPWRNKIQKIVSKNYPSLSFPHLGYESYSPIMIHGEQYARTINGSFLVPACGTIAKEIIRKHFEIPACRSCLITEESPSLKAAGFIDMKNCVFADEGNVLDKIDFLFNNRDQLSAITDAGFNLVHEKHTFKNRNEIYQWYILNKTIKPSERIVQISPFELLQVVEKSTGVCSSHVNGEGLHLKLLKQGDEKLQTKQYAEAERFFLECLNYIPWMPEPKLRLAICTLYNGDSKKALNLVLTPIQINFSMYKAYTPEPVEWAYLIRSLLCNGQLSDAIMRANQFVNTKHLELSRIRWVTNFLQTQITLPLPPDAVKESMHTVHVFPPVTFKTWIVELCIMLTACNQPLFVEALSKYFSGTDLEKKRGAGANAFKHQMINLRIKYLELLNKMFNYLQVPQRETGLPSSSELDFALRLGKVVGIDVLKKYIQDCSSARQKYKIKNLSPITGKPDDLYINAIQSLCVEEEIKTVLILSATTNNEYTSKIETILKALAVETHVFCYIDILLSTSDVTAKKQGTSISLKDYLIINQIEQVDLIVIVPSVYRARIEVEEIQRSKFIFLIDINTSENFNIKDFLLSKSSYNTIAIDPSLGKGYAVLKKTGEASLA